MRQAHNLLPLTSLDNFSRDLRNAILEENKKGGRERYRRKQRLEETEPGVLVKLHRNTAHPCAPTFNP